MCSQMRTTVDGAGFMKQVCRLVAMLKETLFIVVVVGQGEAYNWGG